MVSTDVCLEKKKEKYSKMSLLKILKSGKRLVLERVIIVNTVDSRYLDFVYVE